MGKVPRYVDKFPDSRPLIGSRTLELIFLKSQVAMTEKELQVAAGNNRQGVLVLNQLFDTRGDEISVTKSVIVAAIRALASGWNTSPPDILTQVVEKAPQPLLVDDGFVQGIVATNDTPSIRRRHQNGKFKILHQSAVYSSNYLKTRKCHRRGCYTFYLRTAVVTMSGGWVEFQDFDFSSTPPGRSHRKRDIRTSDGPSQYHNNQREMACKYGVSLSKDPTSNLPLHSRHLRVTQA